MNLFYRTTDGNPLIRFGIVNPSLESLSIVCCASAGYHAVRRNVRKTGCAFTPNEKELSVGGVRHYWTVFADAFTADARERSAPYTRFSVASFLRFLIDLDQASTMT